MINVARSLSPRAEFCVVVFVGFGYFIFANALYLLYPSAESAITDAGLRELVVFEAVVLCLLAALLYARGWRFARLGLPLSLADVGIAVALMIGAYVASIFTTLAAAWIDPNAVGSLGAVDLVANDIRLRNLVAVSIVNPIFEEVLLCGYVVTVLSERRSFWMAVNVSVGIRLACHLYQGPVAVVSILPLGLVFTYWYARTRRIWPLIIAHAGFDVLGLWPYVADDVA
jgi:membrane protease YdiL (CAAX protease family)